MPSKAPAALPHWPEAPPIRPKLGADMRVALCTGLLIGALLFSGAQAIRCGILSTNRLQGLLAQLAVIQTVDNEAKVHNAVLQDKVSLYSSPLGIEEIARDRLGMVKEDEILVRLYPGALAQR